MLIILYSKLSLVITGKHELETFLVVNTKSRKKSEQHARRIVDH